MLNDTLHHLLTERGYSPGQAARLAGLPKTSIVNWLGGRVVRPRYWEPLVQLGRALRLTAAELDQLLTAAHHPPLTRLWASVSTPAQRELLAFWQSQTPAQLPTLLHARQQGEAAHYLALLRPLVPLWLAQGLYDQAAYYLDWPPTEPPLLHLFRAQIARHQQAYTTAERHLRRGLPLARAGSWEHAALLTEWGVVCACMERNGAADHAFQQAHDHAAPYPDLLATIREEWGIAAFLRDDLDTAESHYRTGLAQSAAYPAGTVMLSKSLGALKLWQGELDTAEQQTATGLALAQAIGHHVGQACLHNNGAAVAMHQQNWPLAAERLATAEALAVPLAHPKLLLVVWVNAGLVAHQLGDETAARSYFTAAQQHPWAEQMGGVVAKATAATAALDQGQPLPVLSPSLLL
ncbi:MAG: helix-turn-helix transcriptional regulator [Chloroflexi bacterium]|nr:helix-turn-helix transcriptional regulator [Chloroflexota bacterium]